MALVAVSKIPRTLRKVSRMGAPSIVNPCKKKVKGAWRKATMTYHVRSVCFSTLLPMARYAPELDVGGLQLGEVLGVDFDTASTDGTLAALLVALPESAPILTKGAVLKKGRVIASSRRSITCSTNLPECLPKISYL